VSVNPDDWHTVASYGSDRRAGEANAEELALRLRLRLRLQQTRSQKSEREMKEVSDGTT